MTGFALIQVKSGAHSLRSLENGEVFHPVIGPVQEAMDLHIRQQNLVGRARDGFVIWDVGLGAAGNAIPAIEVLSKTLAPGQRATIHSFDVSTAALEFAARNAAALDYPAPHVKAIRELLSNGCTSIRTSGEVRWVMHLGDFTCRLKNQQIPEAPDAIFYDPYSPKRNREMWTLEHFGRLREVLSKACTATTYTRSTAMRVTFLCAGFFVGRGSGIGEKDETTVLATHRELLETPLDPAWLERVRRSTNSAPLMEVVSGNCVGGDGTDGGSLISSAMLARLEIHPQFAGGRIGDKTELSGV